MRHLFADLTDVTLADEDTNSILTCDNANSRGVYLSRKPNFQLSHFLALLIFSCPPFGQECEFSVVRIEMDPFN